jgi:putative nucleotidyltransferase with HDIG domain
MESEAQTVDSEHKVVLSSLEIPSIPAVALKIIHVLGDSNLSAHELEKIVTLDQSITIKLLQVANSPHFSRGCEIGKVSDAIIRIGFETVRTLVVMASLRGLRQKSCDVDKLIWEHSAAVGVGATVIARKLGFDHPGDFLVPALLHDVGKVILNRNAPTIYSKVLAQVSGEGASFPKSEQTFFGQTHANIGAYAASVWRLPADISSVIALHHEDIEPVSLEADTKEKLLVVMLADSLCSKLGLGLGGSSTGREMQYLALFGVKNPAWLDEAEAEIRKAFPEQRNWLVGD